MMKYNFSEVKNQKLQLERGICFKDAIEAIENNEALDIVDHPNQKKYPPQKMYVVVINDDIHLVPFIRIDENTVFLKTVFASRKTKKSYINKLENEVTYEKIRS